MLRMPLGQGQRIEQVEVKRLDAVAHKPEWRRVLIAEIVGHAPRSHRLRRNDAQHLARRCLQIAVEMGFLTTHQRGKILAKPGRILVHISVDTQFQPRLFRLKRHKALVAQHHLKGRLPVPFAVGEPAFHAINAGTIGPAAVGNPRSSLLLASGHGIKRRTTVVSLAEKGYGVIAFPMFEYQVLQTTVGRNTSFPVAVLP